MLKNECDEFCNNLNLRSGCLINTQRGQRADSEQELESVIKHLLTSCHWSRKVKVEHNMSTNVSIILVLTLQFAVYA